MNLSNGESARALRRACRDFSNERRDKMDHECA